MWSASKDTPDRGLSKEEQLDKALESTVRQLPENQPKGWLGEKNPDMLKTDDFAPDLNAGISQENDMPVIWMAILLGYFVFFIPGFIILWSSKRVPIKTKIVATIVMTAGAASVLILVLLRG